MKQNDEWSTGDVSAIVVAFHPTEQIIGRLKSASEQFAYVIVCNNGIADALLIEMNHTLPANVRMIGDGTNVGIAHALNDGILAAFSLETQFIATFDQDSDIPVDYVTTMLRHYGDLSDSGVSIGFIAPLMIDRSIGVSGGLLKFHGWGHIRKTSDFAPVEEVSVVITSGAFAAAHTYRRAGPFLEDLFIDYVDNEYCLRLLCLGYRHFVATQLVMPHALGNTVVHMVGRRRVKPTHHSVLRKYYLSRNRVFVLRKYLRDFPGLMSFEVPVFLVDSARVVLFEEHALRKVRAILKGVWDGFWFRAHSSASFADLPDQRTANTTENRLKTR